MTYVKCQSIFSLSKHAYRTYDEIAFFLIGISVNIKLSLHFALFSLVINKDIIILKGKIS